MRRNIVASILAIAAVSSLACRRKPESVVAAPTTPSHSASSPSSDLKFLDTMTAHHEQAVVLWQQAATRAVHRELRIFAAKAVEEQRREMFLMHSWRDRWFAGAPPSRSSAESMAEGRMTMPPDTASGATFDEAFLAMMIPHHQRAAAMARAVPTARPRRRWTRPSRLLIAP